MLYLAIALILVGILCFLYLSFTPSATQENSTPLGSMRKPLSEQDYYESISYNKKMQNSRDIDEKIIRDRDIPPQFNQPKETIYTKPLVTEEKPEVVESVQVFGKDGQPVEEAPEERFIVHGTLYLDTKGKLSLGKENLTDQEWKEEYFLDFRRVGEGSLVEEGGKLSFRVKNLTYTLQASDMEQVAFYDEAIVFVPNRKDYATAVFFTKNIDQAKAFFMQAANSSNH